MYKKGMKTEVLSLNQKGNQSFLSSKHHEITTKEITNVI